MRFCFHKLYEDLMNFWKKEYPNKIYTLDYELLVKEPETDTKKFQNNIKLYYDAAYYNLHKNKRQINTTSHSQVRKRSTAEI